MALERTVECSDGQQARVVFGERAVDLDRDPADVAARELECEPPELRRERDERAEHLEVLRADGRDVDGVRDEPAFERRGDLLGDDHTGAVLRLLGRRGEVWRDDDIRRPEQRPVVRLLREDVDRGARELARFEGGDERLLVDELAAGGIDEPRAVTHACDCSGIDRPACVVVQRQVQREEVGPPQHLVERGADDAEIAKALGGDERIVGDDLHQQAERAARDLPPDAPEPEHAEHHFDRSHRPSTSAACACGMLRASASSNPTACSAAETTFDSGAFATTIPRLVAASTSTLSTPTPARPITRNFDARSMMSAVTFVADRTINAS